MIKVGIIRMTGDNFLKVYTGPRIALYPYLTMIPIGRYGQPNPVMRASLMVEHHIMREKKLKIH